MRESFAMRYGIAAALILATLLACPALAEPVTPPSAPIGSRPATPSPANAAAAAASAAKAASAKRPENGTSEAGKQATATPTTSTPGSLQGTAAATANDEAPAEPGTTPDAPPTQAAVSPDANAVTPTAADPTDSNTDDAKPDAAGVPAEPAATATVPTAAADKTKPKLIAAKTLFGAAKGAAPLAARSIGTYARGCLAGAKPLAVDGPTWQAMRLSRNRTWGHPDLIALLERFAGEVKQDGWPGLLVGDISQPRGGPMLTGHASHQVGLDADIWFTPMPDHRMSKKERETLSATSMLADDSLSVDPKVWTDSRVKIIKRIASYAKVERVLVHPAIKKALCQAAGTDRHWLNKVRPYWGHFYHFHVRIGCPAGSTSCKAQAPVPGDDGCGKELDDWFKLLARKPKPKPLGEPKVVVKPSKPKPPVTLDDMPAECRTVLAAGSDIKLPPPAVASAGHKAKAGKPQTAQPADGKPSSAKSTATKPAAKPAETKAAPTKAAAAKSVETKKE